MDWALSGDCLAVTEMLFQNDHQLVSIDHPQVGGFSHPTDLLTRESYSFSV